MKQVQKQPPSAESVTKEAAETNHQRRKRSIKKELERIAKEGRKKKKKEFQKCFGVKYPSQAPFEREKTSFHQLSRSSLLGKLGRRLQMPNKGSQIMRLKQCIKKTFSRHNNNALIVSDVMCRKNRMREISQG